VSAREDHVLVIANETVAGRSLIEVRLSGMTACECEWMTDMTSGRAL